MILSVVVTALCSRAFVRGDDSKPSPVHMEWQNQSALPDPRGVASPFAGTHRDVVLVAGGANFPEKAPWDGGQKVWHDKVWVLEKPDGMWREAGHLPKPLGYGVSISTNDGVICIGGSDAGRHHAIVFRLSWRDGKVDVQSLPVLPRPVANACGAICGNTIYVAGGTETPTATSCLKSFFSLNLDEPHPKWKELAAWPGAPRMLSVATNVGNDFYLVSGTDLSADADGKPKRHYLKDAYRYRPDSGWSRIADVPHSVVAAPSPAPTVAQRGFLVLGGDDGSRLGFHPPQDHPGFPARVLLYDSAKNSWAEFGSQPAPRVTAPVVKWKDRWLIPSGEKRPGVRSPEVWSLSILDNDPA